MNGNFFESADVSDVGRKRKNNEDACLRITEHDVFCVADGMGGQAGGDLASETIITTLREIFKNAAGEDDSLAGRITLFRKATNKASKWIKKFADEKVIGQMGSTVVALIIDPQNPRRAVALHAGDSRLYRYRRGVLTQITVDHSAVVALAAKLGIAPENIPAKYQNELLRAVGLSESVELEKTLVEISSGDIFLICSDGLPKMLSDTAVAEILQAGMNSPMQAIAQQLIDEANLAGGKDNTTVILVKALDFAGAPNIIGSDELDDDKTVLAPDTTTELEAPTMAASAQFDSKFQDAEDIHGDTPHTPTPVTQTTTKTDLPAPVTSSSKEEDTAVTQVKPIALTQTPQTDPATTPGLPSPLPTGPEKTFANPESLAPQPREISSSEPATNPVTAPISLDQYLSNQPLRPVYSPLTPPQPSAPTPATSPKVPEPASSIPPITKTAPIVTLSKVENTPPVDTLPINQIKTSVPVVPTKPNRQNKMPLVAALIGLAVLVAAGGLWLANQNGSKPSPSIATNPSPAPQMLTGLPPATVTSITTLPPTAAVVPTNIPIPPKPIPVVDPEKVKIQTAYQEAIKKPKSPGKSRTLRKLRLWQPPPYN